jgi:hypothetical protein
VETPAQFRNLSDNYMWAQGLNTSFSQAAFALPTPPYQPNWPEFFDGATFNRTAPGHPGFLPTGPTGGLFGNYYWPTTERSIANVGAAFPEAIIRTVFGYQPGWATVAGADPASLLAHAAAPRPFTGTLTNLRTPVGLVNLHASASGVSAELATTSMEH